MSLLCGMQKWTKNHKNTATGGVSASSAAAGGCVPASAPTHNNHAGRGSVGASSINDGAAGGASAAAGSSRDRRELDILKTEVHSLRAELSKCKDTIGRLHETETKLTDRLSEQAQRQLEKGTLFENLNLGDNRPTQLIRRYGNLFTQSRLDAYDALDDLPDMAEFDDLKGKLLFSVVVLSFRSVQQWLLTLQCKLRTLLCLPAADSQPAATPDPMAREVEDTIAIYLRKTVDKYDISKCVADVSQQVWATLYDYPSLKQCNGLAAYIEETVRLAWAMSIQNPPLVINYEMRAFDPDLHSRFHTSNPESEQIQCVLWPALTEGDNGTCLYRAVVIT
eukprot:GHVU01003648.1.p1 GENE.GHVU01003648.1~~GHVU01003648.1.p1  ORF type:complete len:336 (-),score=33.77 GHVU01003648.1:2424-3431(-)